jgi:MFS transporter, DHA2 family, multidrug resistance protein
VVTREALTISFNDVFCLMWWRFLAALVMVPFCRPPRQIVVQPGENHQFGCVLGRKTAALCVNL